MEARRGWYILQTVAGQELKVKENLEKRIKVLGLEDKIFEVVVPTEKVVQVRGGKKITKERSLFPGYVFVDMVLDDKTWRTVRSTPGVMKFVTTGRDPLPLSDEEVRDLLVRAKKAEKKDLGISIGDWVRIKSGSFAGREGEIVEVDPERGRVRIAIALFGREVTVDIDFAEVEKITE